MDYQNSRESRFSGVYLAFEVFRKGTLRKWLAVAYVVLQACISFLRRFRRERCAFLFLPCAHKNVVAQIGLVCPLSFVPEVLATV